jgi:hypothetical protein
VCDGPRCLPPPHPPTTLQKVFRSGAPAITIALWTILILIFPIVGLVIWWFCGPKDTGKTTTAGPTTSVV